MPEQNQSVKEIKLPYVILDQNGKIYQVSKSEKVQLDNIYILEGWSKEIMGGLSVRDMSLKDLNNWLTQRIGLDLRKYGYVKPAEQVFIKTLEKNHSGNHQPKEEVLETISELFGRVDEVGQDKLLDIINLVAQKYPELKGSRDQSGFRVKKKVVSVLVNGIPYCLTAKQHDQILQVLVPKNEEGLLKENYGVWKNKQYSDGYAKYNYSEEQQKHAHDIYTMGVDGLLDQYRHLNTEQKHHLIEQLWDFDTTHKQPEKRDQLIWEAHFGPEQPNKFKTLTDKLETARKREAKEYTCLKSLIIEEAVKLFAAEEEPERAKILDFLAEELVTNQDWEENKSKTLQQLRTLYEGSGKRSMDKKKILEILLGKKEVADDYRKNIKYDYDFKPILKIFRDKKSDRELIVEMLKSKPGVFNELTKLIGEELLDLESKHHTLYREFADHLTEDVMKKLMQEDWLLAEDNREILIDLYKNNIFKQAEEEMVVDFIIERLNELNKLETEGGKISRTIKKIMPKIKKMRGKEADLPKEQSKKQQYLTLLTKIYQYCNNPTRHYISFQVVTRQIKILPAELNNQAQNGSD